MKTERTNDRDKEMWERLFPFLKKEKWGKVFALSMSTNLADVFQKCKKEKIYRPLQIGEQKNMNFNHRMTASDPGRRCLVGGVILSHINHIGDENEEQGLLINSTIM